MSTSDATIPYTVTPGGVQLPDGHVFQAHGHINIKITTNDGAFIRDVNMHFDPNNGHPGGDFIGEGFFPVSLAEGECIGWVQIHGFNEHFGEGGQDPVCVTPKPDPDPEEDPEDEDDDPEEDPEEGPEEDPEDEDDDPEDEDDDPEEDPEDEDDDPEDETPEDDPEDETEDEQDTTPTAPQEPGDGADQVKTITTYTTTTASPQSTPEPAQLAQTGADALTPILLAGAALVALGATLITKKFAKTRS